MKNIFLTVLMGFCLGSAPLMGAPQKFEEDLHFYEILPEPPMGKVGDKIEVVEFFLYTCPHCYRFEPVVEKWLESKADDIEFTRIPALFGGAADMHGQAYYALQSMGKIEELHNAFFHAIHEEGNRLQTREALDSFIQSQGIDLEQFRQAMRSFAVVTKTNRAKSLLQRYGIRSVPSVVVDGRYKNGSGLDHDATVALIDHLAEKVRQARKAASSK